MIEIPYLVHIRRRERQAARLLRILSLSGEIADSLSDVYSITLFRPQIPQRDSGDRSSVTTMSEASGSPEYALEYGSQVWKLYDRL